MVGSLVPEWKLSAWEGSLEGPAIADPHFGPPLTADERRLCIAAAAGPLLPDGSAPRRRLFLLQRLEPAHPGPGAPPGATHADPPPAVSSPGSCAPPPLCELSPDMRLGSGPRSPQHRCPASVGGGLPPSAPQQPLHGHPDPPPPYHYQEPQPFNYCGAPPPHQYLNHEQQQQPTQQHHLRYPAEQLLYRTGQPQQLSRASGLDCRPGYIGGPLRRLAPSSGGFNQGPVSTQSAAPVSVARFQPYCSRTPTGSPSSGPVNRLLPGGGLPPLPPVGPTFSVNGVGSGPSGDTLAALLQRQGSNGAWLLREGCPPAGPPCGRIPSQSQLQLTSQPQPQVTSQPQLQLPQRDSLPPTAAAARLWDAWVREEEVPQLEERTGGGGDGGADSGGRTNGGGSGGCIPAMDNGLGRTRHPGHSFCNDSTVMAANLLPQHGASPAPPLPSDAVAAPVPSTSFGSLRNQDAQPLILQPQSHPQQQQQQLPPPRRTLSTADTWSDGYPEVWAAAFGEHVSPLSAPLSALHPLSLPLPGAAQPPDLSIGVGRWSGGAGGIAPMCSSPADPSSWP